MAPHQIYWNDDALTLLYSMLAKHSTTQRAIISRSRYIASSLVLL